MSEPGAPRALGVPTATLSVAASMVGTGVFTTTGFLLADLSPPAVLVAWLVGGVSALAGATAYAELGAAYAENGGEYLLLGRIFHRRLGFVAGVVSLVVGFAAPIAACGTAFSRYLREVVDHPFPDVVVACALVVGATLAHVLHVRIGARFLAGVTGVQLLACTALAVVGLASGSPANLAPAPGWTAELGTSAFASSLVWISYAYAGWGAAAYVAGEVRDPGRTLPVALGLGTGLVTLLYLAINAAILASAPAEVLRGQLAVAHVAAREAVGPMAGSLLSAVVATGLTGTVLALSLTGSRVAEAMARDLPALRFLSGRTAGGSPTRALAALAAVAVAFVVTSTFDALVTFTGFVLAVFAMTTVVAALVSRVTDPDRPRPFRVPAAPLVWAVYLVPTAWAVVATCLANPWTLAAGGALVAGVAALGWVASGRSGA
jgi:APA family basic amino acid/polyamine antiporter